ncbi:MAG TPA: BON domain-containing protein [Casimicrobiaceae bacterium]|nr:BON domain-containing protein [Casimicrobiaceae bacterium]
MNVLHLLSALIGLASLCATAQPAMQLDPFTQATNGMPSCPTVVPRLYSPDEMRTEAHARSERGTRCALEGICEPGGAYKRDGEINEQVRAEIAADKRFADTSVWVTTSRKWVTLKGCVRTKAENRALITLARHQANVERVFDELTLSHRR